MPSVLLFTLFVASLSVVLGLWTGRRLFGRGTAAAPETVLEPLLSGLAGYMHRVSVTLGGLGAALFLVLWWVTGVRSAIGLAIGLLIGYAAAHLLMETTVHLAARTGTTRAEPSQLLRQVSRAGRAGGALLAGFGLLAVTAFYLILRLMTPTGEVFDMRPLIGLGIGVSVVSLYVRLGGELFTRSTMQARSNPDAADPAAAAVLETVGRNAGLLTGVGLELLESLLLTLLGTMLLGNLLLGSSPLALEYPLLLGAFGVLAFMAAELLVFGRRQAEPAPPLFRMLWTVLGLVLIAFYALALWFPEHAPPGAAAAFYPAPLTLFTAELLGLGLAAGLLLLVRSGRRLSAAEGWLRLGMHGAIVLGLAIGLWAAYVLGGHYGVAVAVLALQSLAAPVAVLAAYTPTLANRRETAALGGGEVSNPGEDVPLRELEHVTGAVTRTFVVASALLASMVLFLGLTQLAGGDRGAPVHPALTDMRVVGGLLFGALLPYLFQVAEAEAVTRGAARLESDLDRALARTERSCGELERNADRLARAVHWELLRIVWLPLAASGLLALVLGAAGLGGALVGAMVAGLLATLALRTAMAPGAARRAGDTPTVSYESTGLGPPLGPLLKALALLALLIVPYI